MFDPAIYNTKEMTSAFFMAKSPKYSTPGGIVNVSSAIDA